MTSIVVTSIERLCYGSSEYKITLSNNAEIIGKLNITLDLSIQTSVEEATAIDHHFKSAPLDKRQVIGVVDQVTY